ncbi:MAG: type III pantothenate kinase [Planctomycetota bacterium]
MIAVVDIGNTSCSFGFFRNDKLVKTFKVPCSQIKEISKYYKQPKGLIEEFLVLSVNPPVKRKLCAWVRKNLNIKPKVAGRDFYFNIPVLLRKPETVGTDRLANALAGYQIYGGPLIVADFGSAVTFDVISKKGEYLGGAIAPGIMMSAKSLYEKTALLPFVKPFGKPEPIGKDTESAILSGLFFGFIGMTQKLIEEISIRLGEKPKVIATGGDADFMAFAVPLIEKVVTDLTLRGALLAYQLDVTKKQRK